MRLQRLIAIASVLLLVSTAACAVNSKTPVPADFKLKEECGGCHMVYPPGLLTGADWQRLMDGLEQHFGSDASLDAQDRQDVLGFLLGHAGRGARHSAASLRISETPWFNDMHHGITGRIYSNSIIKSRANCTACHANAERGIWYWPPHVHSRRYNDDDN